MCAALRDRTRPYRKGHCSEFSVACRKILQTGPTAEVPMVVYDTCQNRAMQPMQVMVARRLPHAPSLSSAQLPV